MDFQVGDVVKCVNAGIFIADPEMGKTPALSEGKNYRVLQVHADRIEIVDDTLKLNMYFKERFVRVAGPIAEIEVLY